MPDGLRLWLAELADGSQGPWLSWDNVASWIRDQKWLKSEIDRMADSRKRHQYYSSAGDEHIKKLIRDVHHDKDVIRLRAEWVETSKHVNVLKRLVNERSTVYSVPAKRSVAKTGDNKRYQELQRLTREDEMALRWNRWGNLHNSLLVGQRVRTEASGEKKPVIDVITPGHFFVIAAPYDSTKILGYGIEIGADSPIRQDEIPHWMIITNKEQFFLTKNGALIKSSIKEHGWARMPYVLLSIEPPYGEVIDSTTGDSAVAAHEQVWFQHVLLAKESKSATKLPVTAGDMTETSRLQMADTEGSLELAAGTVFAAVDLGMDLDQFRDNASYIYEMVAADYGIPPSLLSHAGTQSAEARELLRAPLLAIRREQEIYFREFEREFAEVQSMVMGRELPSLAFDTKGWRIDFRESSTPLNPKAATEVFEHKKRLGLTNTIEELMRLNPDLEVEDAIDQLLLNIEMELLRNQAMRPLQEVNGSMGAEQDQTAPPQGEDTTEAERGLRSVPPTDSGDNATPANGRGRRRRNVTQS